MTTCEHPETLHYVIQLEDMSKRDIFTELGDCIVWCRGCGALRGWRPADRRKDSHDEWQAPDGIVPHAALFGAEFGPRRSND